MMFFQVKKSILTACMGAIAFLVVEGVQGIALKPKPKPIEGGNKAEAASIEFLDVYSRSGIVPAQRVGEFLNLQEESHLHKTCSHALLRRANTEAEKSPQTDNKAADRRLAIARLRANPDFSDDSWTLDDIDKLKENGFLGSQREFHLNGRTPKARHEQLDILRELIAAESLPSGVTIYGPYGTYYGRNVQTMLSTAVSVIVEDETRNAVTMFKSVKELLSAVAYYKDPESAGVDNRMPRLPRFPSHVPAGAPLELYLRKPGIGSSGFDEEADEDIAGIREFFNLQGKPTIFHIGEVVLYQCTMN
jgi:hypothetical protein